MIIILKEIKVDNMKYTWNYDILRNLISKGTKLKCIINAFNGHCYSKWQVYLFDYLLVIKHHKNLPFICNAHVLDRLANLLFFASTLRNETA